MICCSALYLSCKLVESATTDLKDLSQITDYSVRVDDILNCESKIAAALNFRLHPLTPYQFLLSYILVAEQIQEIERKERKQKNSIAIQKTNNLLKRFKTHDSEFALILKRQHDQLSQQSASKNFQQVYSQASEASSSQNNQSLGAFWSQKSSQETKIRQRRLKYFGIKAIKDKRLWAIASYLLQVSSLQISFYYNYPPSQLAAAVFYQSKRITNLKDKNVAQQEELRKMHERQKKQHLFQFTHPDLDNHSESKKEQSKEIQYDELDEELYYKSTTPSSIGNNIFSPKKQRRVDKKIHKPKIIVNTRHSKKVVPKLLMRNDTTQQQMRMDNFAKPIPKESNSPCLICMKTPCICLNHKPNPYQNLNLRSSTSSVSNQKLLMNFEKKSKWPALLQLVTGYNAKDLMPMRNKIFETIEKYGEFTSGSIKKYKNLFPQYEEIYPQAQRLKSKPTESQESLNFRAQISRFKSRNLFKSQKGKLKLVAGLNNQRQQQKGMKTPQRQNINKRDQERASLLSTHPTSPRPQKLSAFQTQKLENMFKKQAPNSGAFTQINRNGLKSISKEQEEKKPIIVGGLKKDPKLFEKDRGFKQVTTKMFQQMQMQRQKTLWDFQPKIADGLVDDKKKMNSNQSFSKSRAQMLITKGIQKSNSQKKQEQQLLIFTRNNRLNGSIKNQN